MKYKPISHIWIHQTYIYIHIYLNLLLPFLSSSKLIEYLRNLEQQLLLFDDDKIEIARKPGKKQKGNQVGYIGDSKRWIGNIRKGYREGKTVTVSVFSLEVRWPLWGWFLITSIARIKNPIRWTNEHIAIIYFQACT